MKRERKETTSAIAKLSQKYGLEEVKLVETLKATVIKPKKITGRDGKPDQYIPATTEEVNAFLMVAAQYDLDPMLKQIHAFVDNRPGAGIVPIVGYDGWVRLVNREKRFAGFESIDHLDEKGNLYAITGKMRVLKDPSGAPELGSYTVEVTEYLEECRGTTTPWQKWPQRMLRNKAYSQAARMAFGLSGIYDEDEGDRIREAGEMDAIDVTPTKVPQALPGRVPDKPSPEVEKKTAQEPAGEPISHAPQGSPSPEGKGAAAPSPAAEAPKTDEDKRSYIGAVAERASKQFGIEVAQVVFDLSKFISTKAGEEGKEIGARDLSRLSGRWLNSTYGAAKKLEAELDAPFGGLGGGAQAPLHPSLQRRGPPVHHRPGVCPLDHAGHRPAPRLPGRRPRGASEGRGEGYPDPHRLRVGGPRGAGLGQHRCHDPGAGMRVQGVADAYEVPPDPRRGDRRVQALHVRRTPRPLRSDRSGELAHRHQVGAAPSGVFRPGGGAGDCPAGDDGDEVVRQDSSRLPVPSGERVVPHRSPQEPAGRERVPRGPSGQPLQEEEFVTIDRKLTVTAPQDAPLPEAAQAAEEANVMLTVAQSFAIDSSDAFLSANEELKAIKAKFKQIENKRQELKAPVLEAGKRIDDMFRPALETLKQAELACKKSMGAWQDEQDRIRRAAEAKAREEFEKAERARLKALEKGDEKALAKAEERIAEAAAAVAVVPETPVARGFYQVEVWSAEVVNFPELVAAVAKGKSIFDFLMPNQKKLDDYAKAMNGEFNVPGCRAVMTKTQGSRS
jgi:phage recombination protein Bet